MEKDTDDKGVLEMIESKCIQILTCSYDSSLVGKVMTKEEFNIFLANMPIKGNISIDRDYKVN